MGNSRTGRYADGADLFSAEAAAQAFLRAWARSRPRGVAMEPLVVMPRRLLRAAQDAARPTTASGRRMDGEVARLLIDPGSASRVRRLGLRHGFDEGDVARVWASTAFRVQRVVETLPSTPEAESA